MSNNKITVIQGLDTIQVVQPNNEIVVSVNQESNVVTIVEKGPKGDKGDAGSASDLTTLNNFTGSIQSQVNALMQATSSYLTASMIDSYVLSSTLASTLTSYTQNSSTGSFVKNSQTSSFVVSSTLSNYTLNSSTSSFVLNDATSSFVANSQTSSFVVSSTLANYVLNNTTSSFVQNSATSSFVNSSTLTNYVLNSNTSSFVTNSKTGSFATTGSNTFTGTQTVSGSLIITQNLTVLGSSSILYVTSSQLNIANNLITVNTNFPSVRYGGFAVIDSGSSPQVSGSLLFDSQENQWLFVHQGNVITSSILIMGPETYNSLGNETHPTTNRIIKSINDEHIGDSNITDTGTIVSINSNTQITGSLIATSFTGSLFGTASWASSAVSAPNYVQNSSTSSFVLNSVTSSMSVLLATSASYVNSLNQSLIITGSTQGNVTVLSITSNTASLDLNLGNFFTLQLVAGTNTYINPSNIKPGQSSMLLVSTIGSATVSFPTSVKQPSGSTYVPTTTTGTDILTFASLDTTNLYVVNVKNLI